MGVPVQDPAAALAQLDHGVVPEGLQGLPPSELRTSLENCVSKEASASRVPGGGLVTRSDSGYNAEDAVQAGSMLLRARDNGPSAYPDPFTPYSPLDPYSGSPEDHSGKPPDYVDPFAYPDRPNGMAPSSQQGLFDYTNPHSKYPAFPGQPNEATGSYPGFPSSNSQYGSGPEGYRSGSGLGYTDSGTGYPDSGSGYPSAGSTYPGGRSEYPASPFYSTGPDSGRSGADGDSGPSDSIFAPDGFRHGAGSSGDSGRGNDGLRSAGASGDTPNVDDPSSNCIGAACTNIAVLSQAGEVATAPEVQFVPFQRIPGSSLPQVTEGSLGCPGGDINLCVDGGEAE